MPRLVDLFNVRWCPSCQDLVEPRDGECPKCEAVIVKPPQARHMTARTERTPGTMSLKALVNILNQMPLKHPKRRIPNTDEWQTLPLTEHCPLCGIGVIYGIYKVTNYRGGVHFETACARCGLYRIPRRLFMGVPCVKEIGVECEVRRLGSDEWILGSGAAT